MPDVVELVRRSAPSRNVNNSISHGGALETDLALASEPIRAVATVTRGMGITELFVVFRNGQYAGTELSSAFEASNAFYLIAAYVAQHDCLAELEGLDIAYGEARYTREHLLVTLALARKGQEILGFASRRGAADLRRFRGPITRVSTSKSEFGAPRVIVEFGNGEPLFCELHSECDAGRAFFILADYIARFDCLSRLQSFSIAFHSVVMGRPAGDYKIGFGQSELQGLLRCVRRGRIILLTAIRVEYNSFFFRYLSINYLTGDARSERDLNDERALALKEITEKIVNLPSFELKRFVDYVRAFVPAKSVREHIDGLKLKDRWSFLSEYYSDRVGWDEVRSEDPTPAELTAWADKSFPDRVELGLVFSDLQRLDRQAYTRIKNWKADPADFGFPLKTSLPKPDAPVEAGEVFRAYRTNDPAARKLDRAYQRQQRLQRHDRMLLK